MARLTDTNALIQRLDKCVGETGLGLEPVMAIRDIKELISLMPTVDAIPVDWLERRLDETAEATAQGNDQTELNNAIFTVLVEWTKATLRKKDGGEHNGEDGH